MYEIDARCGRRSFQFVVMLGVLVSGQGLKAIKRVIQTAARPNLNSVTVDWRCPALISSAEAACSPRLN